MNSRPQTEDPAPPPCQCAVCGRSFAPNAATPRLKVREFQFCLCGDTCAGRLLAEPERYVEARREQLRLDPEEQALCPIGFGPCPYLARKPGSRAL